MTRDEIEALAFELDTWHAPLSGRDACVTCDERWPCPSFRAVAALRALSKEVRELREDRDLCENTRTNMRRILDDVAEALKGPPAALHSHDWSDLPALVRDLQGDFQMALDSASQNKAAKDQMRYYGRETREERDRLKVENEGLRADKERLDWLERAVCSGVNLVAEHNSVWLTRWRRRYISFHEWVGTGLRAALDAARAGENTP